MNELKLYKNSKPYPYYTDTLTLVDTKQVTPRNQDLKGGYVDLQLTLDEVLSFNYLSYASTGRTVYAWVTDIEELGGNLLKRVHFTVDAFRTYKADLVLGNQFILRSPTVTALRDEYLGNTVPYNDYQVKSIGIGNTAKRYAVVQVRGDASEIMSNTPGQPTPYQFYFCEYNVNNWVATTALVNLLNKLTDRAKTSNIVTIYSIPHVEILTLQSASLPVVVTGGETSLIAGWKILHSTDSPFRLFRSVVDISGYLGATWYEDPLTMSNHNISLIIPEAGVLNIPDEIAFKAGVSLVREVDVFSGACNYMVTLDGGMFPTHITCRGSSMSTIPILSDPYDTYVSQNQNALSVGLLGDVATLAVGVGTGNLALAGVAGSGLIGKVSNQMDAQTMIPSNPPSFLGSALVSEYNNRFFLAVTRKAYDNAGAVHARYGYPFNKLAPLYIPAGGFIQTDNCSVSSNGNVPMWAIQEVNSLFNGGILFS